MEDLINFNSPCGDIPHKLTANIPTLNIPVTSPDCSFQLLSDTLMNTTNLIDFGRDSLPFTNRPSMTGRESLQLLPGANFFDIEVTGRESLSVLQHQTPDIKIELDPYQQEDIYINNSVMNQAFLDPSMCERRISNISSISSFNSCSFVSSELSKIYSVHSDFKNSDMNNAFYDRTTILMSDSSMKNSVGSLNSNIKDLPSFGEEQRLRIQSMPAIKDLASPLETNGGSVNIRMCWSAQGSKKGNSRRSSGCSKSFSTEADEDVFNDSVFIEAQHLASQIADGSILETSLDKSNVLDCTAPPDWETEDCEDEVKPKCDTETVFKTLDLMLPITNNNSKPSSNDISKNSQHSNECAETVNHSLKNTSTNSASRNDCMQNLSDIFNSNNRHTSYISNASNTSKSRDAKEILQNLSEILNNDNRDPQQKLAGQSLLLNLADILCSDGSKRSDSLEDSGHSSIDAEEAAATNECYEVLDLSNRRGSTTTQNEKILDLSLKSKVDSIKSSHSQSFPSPQMPPPAVSNNLKKQTATMKNLTGSLDGAWNKSDNSKTGGGLLRSSISLSKLKPRKHEDVKCGPLKAVVPVIDMAKKKEVSTLKKTNSASNISITTPKKPTTNSAHKHKKTSTPINAPKLRPMAQSTPDERNPKVNHSKPIECSSQLKKKRFTCPVSPLARPNSFNNSSTNSQLNNSDSLPDLINNNGSKGSIKSLNRRHSASDLKTTNKNLTLRRSYSIGKENLSSLKKLAPPAADNKAKSSDTKVPNPSRSTTRMFGIKPFNLMSRLGANKTAANV